MKALVSLLAAALLLSGCGDAGTPPLTVSSLALRTPIAGRAVAPGYLTLANNSDIAITIDRIDSPQFARIELHETTNRDGISRMRSVESITIPAGGVLTMAPGGLHLMLFSRDPSQNAITLNFYSDNALVLSATTELEAQ